MAIISVFDITHYYSTSRFFDSGRGCSLAQNDKRSAEIKKSDDKKAKRIGEKKKKTSHFVMSLCFVYYI